MPVNRLDQIYRRIRLTKYFIKGWGSSKNLKRLLGLHKILSSRETCYALIPPNYPVFIEKKHEASDCYTIEGYFISPFVDLAPDIVPEESRKAYFQFVLPKKWPCQQFKPVCLQLAGTGDQYFWRRRALIAKPLLKEFGIGSILLENPFYGRRRPKNQTRTILHNVSDLFVMGGCLLVETLVLLHLSERMGFGPLGISGISMGGHMASICCTNWPKPIVVVPCLSGLTASHVFTRGVISKALNWDLLGEQYRSNVCYKEEVEKIVRIVEDNAFRAGQQYVQNYSDGRSYEECEGPKVTNFSKNSEINGIDSVENSILKSDSFHVSESGSVFLERNRLAGIFSKFQENFARKKRSSEERTEILEWETFNFMNGIMDECTHLKNFTIPVDTSLAIGVCAIDDAYVPIAYAMRDLRDIWPGSQMRYLEGGHVKAYVRHQRDFRIAIADGFALYKEKYGLNYHSSNIIY